MMSEPLIIGENPLDLKEIREVAEGRRPVAVSPGARERVRRSRESVERILESGKAVYGVTTGFGSLAQVAIEADQMDQLQRNLIVSHAVGTGPSLPGPVVRATMLLRAVSLVAGYSGIREVTLDLLIAMLNEDVLPVVPAQGSVGSSGDLAPLAHVALALIGMGECSAGGRVLPAEKALAAAGLQPVALTAKEGLALINGTQVMAAIIALAVLRAERLAVVADIAAAMTLEAVRGLAEPFDERLQRLRPHRGQTSSAANIRRLINGSEAVCSDKERMQDAYSLRCAPVVHGASRDAMDHVRRVLEIEINSVTDNPLIFPEEDTVLSGGNFHGQPLAITADLLGIAAAELGSISERRTNRLVDGGYGHLPMFVTPAAGLNSGMMMPHYVAAALVSENKGLAHPNSVDSIPTSANQEDHNSMGTIAARTAEEIVSNVETVLAIELMVAAQALEFSGERKLGGGTGTALRMIREAVPALDCDRYLAPDVKKVRELVISDRFVASVSEASGGLE